MCSLLLLLMSLQSFTQVGVPGFDADQIVFDDVNQRVWVTSLNNRLYYLTDQGWMEHTLPRNDLKVHNLSTSGGVVFLSQGSGLYKLSSNGEWERLFGEIPSVYPSYFTFHDHPQLVISRDFTVSGYSRSEDSGETWSTLEAMDETGYFAEIPGTDSLIFVSGTICRTSPDLGVTWHDVSGGTELQYGLGINDLIVLSDMEWFVVGVSIYFDSCHDVYHTIDGGRTWDCINNGLSFPIVLDAHLYQQQFYIAVAQMAAQQQIRGVLRYNRDTGDWETIGSGLPGALPCLFLTDDGHRLLGTTRFSGITAIDPNSGETQLIPGDPRRDNSVSRLKVSPFDTDCWMAQSGVIWLTTDAGENWVMVDSLYHPMDMSFSPVDPNFYAGIQLHKGVRISHDAGATWVDANTGIGDSDRYLLDRIWFTAQGTILVSGYVANGETGTSGSFIYRSANNGQTWSKVVEASGTEQQVSITGLSDEDGDLLVLMIDKGLMRSSDDGINYETVYHETGDTYWGMSRDSAGGIYLIVERVDAVTGGHTYLLYSPDLVTWREIDGSLSNDWYITSICSDPSISGRLYMMAIPRDIYSDSHSVVCHSTDDFGETWTEWHSNTPVSDFGYSVARAGDRLLLGVKGFSILSTDPEWNGVDTECLAPGINSLSNYPNPFNPTTTVQYSLDVGGPVAIDIYNMRGQRVCTLLHENQAAGKHRVTWNGVDSSNQPVSSGVYFCRLTANGKTELKKMLLLK
jgi:photosystem II stability/assembly factor-like uncharacterized protein